MATAQKQPGFLTDYEKGNGNQTATYEQTIAFFKRLDQAFETVAVREMGLTDSGLPLHLVLFSPDKDFSFDRSAHPDKVVLLINNGIHPGEPDGIDATMMLYRDLATGAIKVPKHVLVANIAVYNIGGMLNRNSHSRANQNGPEAYGFRGNARNYDLNRDFVKQDTRNARSFAQVFQSVNPDVFIDNHVSNGADYQYAFTYIMTQPQKLGGALGSFWENEMIPELMNDLRRKKIESVPYVNIHDEKPDGGFAQFLDLPRYSTGYAALFNTLGSMPETHMLKDYATRVAVTYEYMVATLTYLDKNAGKIRQLRSDNFSAYAAGKNYTLGWELDKSKSDAISFLGFEGGYKTSAISGQNRLFYDRSKPFKKAIPYYKTYKPSLEITIPQAYIIPQSWWPVLDLLRNNHVQMQTIDRDTLLEVESYRINDYKTAKTAYEGHYPHSDVKVTRTVKKIQFRKGDCMVQTQQPGVKYLLEMLEPQGADSFFVWNFFDAILQQKEYFSAYVFEDLAADILDKDVRLKKEFEIKKASDQSFAASGAAQLDWIYTHSEHYERTHNEYPVYRLMP